MIKDFDLKKVDNICVEDVDTMDYPDFCDAFISSADYDGKEMTAEELDWLMDTYPDFCYESIINSIT